MKILLTGGGTAGHVTPLLAVASEIQTARPRVHLRYIGKYGDPSGQPAQSHFSIEKTYGIFAGKLRRFHGKPWYWYVTQPKLVFHNLKDTLQFIIGFFQSLIILIVWRPDVIFVKGGFVGLPVGLAAAVLRVPIVTHDSDTIPGLTNRILSRYAHTLAVGAPIDQYPQYTQKRVVFTGVPVRSEFLQPASTSVARKQLDINESAEVIVVIGGSLGAVRVNKAILASLDMLFKNHENRLLYWLTGAYGHEEMIRMVEQKPYNHQIRIEKFSDNLPTIFSAASVIVTRAGATTLAEIAVMKKPAIIIPNPLLTGGHQTKNGHMYAEYSAATVLSEAEIKDNSSTLSVAIATLLTDDNLREKYATQITKLAEPKAAQKIAALVIDVALEGKK